MSAIQQAIATLSSSLGVAPLPTAALPPPPIYYPPPLPSPNLNLPPPPPFSGLIPSEYTGWSISVSQFIMGNPNTYTNAARQVLCAGSLLTGPAREWYHSQVNMATMMLPDHYTLVMLLEELGEFFGAGITVDSRERQLIALRQTTTVSQLAIAFQNLTNTFNPRWPDHPLIFEFSQKLKEGVRFQLTLQGGVP